MALRASIAGERESERVEGVAERVELALEDDAGGRGILRAPPGYRVGAAVRRSEENRCAGRLGLALVRSEEHEEEREHQRDGCRAQELGETRSNGDRDHARIKRARVSRISRGGNDRVTRAADR